MQGWIALLGAVVALGPLTIDMYLPALPVIGTDLQTGSDHVQLTLASYFIGLALGQLIYGPASDRYGRKPPLLIGLAIYVLASLMCTLTSDVMMLVFWRFVQALGGAAGMVITRAIVRDRCDTQQAARAFSLLMLVMGVAPILAPLIGGWILALANWRWIFAVLAGYGALMFLLVLLAIEETIVTRNPLATRLAVIFRNFRHLLGQADFVGYTMSNGLAWAGMFAYITGSAFVFIEGFQLSAQQYAYIFGANAGGLILASQINVQLLKRFRLSFLLDRMMWLPCLTGVSLVILELLGWLNLIGLLVGLFLFIATLGLIGPNGVALAMHNQMKVAGSASALMGALQFTVATLTGATMSLFSSASPRPMLILMAVCGVLALLVYRWTVARMASSL